MQLSVEEVITLSFALDIADEEITNVLAAGDPKRLQKVSDFLELVKLLRKRIDITIAGLSIN